MNVPARLLDLSGPEPRRTFRDYLGGVELPETWQGAGYHLSNLLDRIALEPLPPLPEALQAPAPRPPEWAPGPAQLIYHAPLGLIEGAWLQGLTRAGCGEQAPVAALLRGYLGLLGADTGQAPARFYRGLLARHGIALAPTASDRFSASDAPGTAAFALGALQLALAYGYPDRLAELLGYTIGYAQSTSPWRLAGLDDRLRGAVLRRFAGDVLEALRLLLDQEPGASDRVRRGIALYRLAETEYLQALTESARTPTLAERVAGLFAAKAPTAAPLHHQPTLAGRPLQDWLGTEPFDATGFLAAFAASDWVAGEKGNRPFDRLTAFGGRMFGVFSEEELAWIDEWLDAGDAAPAGSNVLPAPVGGRPGGEVCGSASMGFAAPYPSYVASPVLSPIPAAGATARFRDDRRRLFHQLLDPPTFPDGLADARHLVETELATAGGLAWRSKSPMPLEYSPEAFRDWLDARHRHQLDDQTAIRKPPKLTRNEFQWGIVQLAPAVLVDGCWLGHACLAADQGHPVNRLLLRICGDEAGNGNPAHNHPAIYRRLLESLDITVAATASQEFARSPLFLDAAFDLPTFLLAIGQFPRSFFPEILGLNLAIELSGLGRQYRRLAEDLEYWGIDATIVRLHQSIDNLASGHAALAAEAIRIHLDDIRASIGPAGEARQWRRIRTGYRSLESATRRFKRAMLSSYVQRFLLPKAVAGCVKTLRQIRPWTARLRS